MARLFLALWPDDAVRAELVRWRDAWHWPRSASPVADGKLHLTLHFLGEVDEARLPELAEGFHVPFTPFSIEMARPVVWHRSIAVLEPLSVPGELLALYAALAERIARLGLTVEDRAYRPHVTMARRAGGATPPVSGPPVLWHTDGYALVQSKTDQAGGYSVVQAYS